MIPYECIRGHVTNEANDFASDKFNFKLTDSTSIIKLFYGSCTDSQKG